MRLLIPLFVVFLAWPANAITQPRGDANADFAVDVVDVFYLINNLFAGGPPSLRACLADANADRTVNTADVFYLIQYLFGGGMAPPQPVEVCNSEDDDCDGAIDEAGTCPAPTVVSAEALSATAVRITFSREVEPASVAADGSQFTFDNGLVASAASVNGSTVTVTTSSQTAATFYTVTVANTVTDVQGSPVGSPNSAMFTGFLSPAVLPILVITEVMVNPFSVADSMGEWFEIHNLTSGNFQLQGLVIKDDGSDQFTVTSSLVIPEGGFVVLGNNGNPSTNGGVSVDFIYSGFVLSNSADEIEILNGSVSLDRVAYNSSTFPATPGSAMSLDPDSFSTIDNDTGSNWCEFESLVPGRDEGTPGAMNPDCP